jgi:hypothetical protein
LLINWIDPLLLLLLLLLYSLSQPPPLLLILSPLLLLLRLLLLFTRQQGINVYRPKLYMISVLHIRKFAPSLDLHYAKFNMLSTIDLPLKSDLADRLSLLKRRLLRLLIGFAL